MSKNTAIRKILTTAKINLKNVKPAFIITGILLGLMLTDTVVQSILTLRGVLDARDNNNVSAINVLFLLPALCGKLIPVRNFRKYANLGGKRTDFLKGCLCGYALLAAAVSVICAVYHVTAERFLVNLGTFSEVINLMDLFGWTRGGMAVAVLRQTAFLLLTAVFFHTLSSLHEWWVGWACDAAIIAVISVFTPIAPLRAAEYAFFRAILFQPDALPHILTCLALCAALGALNLPIISRKKI
ncbi:MAG: hypothetical protein LBH54_06115 [Clostridiales bacterium]|jgi:hypothetical protein|nr:hypothetical protein [Clostridiales bacterium]